MRIVAGQYGGRRLEVPKGRDIRPTSDKVRGAIFNALRSRGAVEEARVLDVFCGTGALGLEALSQGAAHCTFMDKARESLELAKRNAQNLGVLMPPSLRGGLSARRGNPELQNVSPDCFADTRNDEFSANFLLKDATKPGDCPGEPFSLIFLDPPYNQSLIVPVLEKLVAGKWLRDGSIVVMEVEKAFRQGLPPAFEPLDEKTYGDTKIMFYGYPVS